MINDTELIDGKLKVLRILGQGGGGTVYVCWNDTLEKEVAVKVLSEPCPDPVSLKRFKKEAQAISVCDHPGIVKLHSFGMCANGKPYYVMDLVNGKSLAAILAEKGKLTPAEFETIFLQVADALAHAHSNGLVHRDIKPSNIMVDTTNGARKVFLIDFGLSRSLTSTKLTVADALLGTPAYMSPEQCTGAFVDHRSDIYSLGCTMYEAATGVPPFTGEAYEILMAHVKQTPPNIPTRLTPLLDQCLAIAPEQRFPGVKELIECLRDLRLASEKDFWLPGVKPAQPARNAVESAVEPSWRRRIPVIFTAVAATLLLAGWWYLREYKSGTDSELSDVNAPQTVPSTTPNIQTLDAFGPDAYAIQIALNRRDYEKVLGLCDAVIPRAVADHLTPDQLASLMLFRLEAIIGLRRELPEILSYAAKIYELKPNALYLGHVEFLLAKYYDEVGKPADAARSYQRTLHLVETVTPMAPDYRGEVYSNYINFLRLNKGTFNQQEEVFYKALNYFEALRRNSKIFFYTQERLLWDSIIQTEIDHRNRDLLKRMSDYLKVEAQTELPWNTKLDSLTYRADAECLLGNLELARSLYDQAIQIGEDNEPKPPKPNTAFALHNKMGFLNPPFAEKIALAIHAAELCSNYGDGDVDAYISCADHIAKIYLDKGQLDKSLFWYSKAARIGEQYAQSRLRSTDSARALPILERTLSMLNSAAAVAARQHNKKLTEQYVQRGEKVLDVLKSNPSFYSAVRDADYRGQFQSRRSEATR